MEQPTVKGRTPSRCREWERNRRIKFNNAISRLGELVKDIIKPVDSTSKTTENVQYPKIEIIEKAIICLQNCAQEKTQLKAEILALQVQLESSKKQCLEKRDASTQVFIGINKRKSNGKYVKVLMLKKSKANAMKENPEGSKETLRPVKTNVKRLAPKAPIQKLPTILPNTNFKKGPENTIVVLPATPYIFPQRPLILPTVPPAFVLLDQNLNKASLPVLHKTTADITKTTTVNILPISAYSRPLSASKVKRSNSKPRNNIKKVNKKVKQNDKGKVSIAENVDSSLKITSKPSVENSRKEPNCNKNNKDNHTFDEKNENDKRPQIDQLCKSATKNAESVKDIVKINHATLDESVSSKEVNINNQPKLDDKVIEKDNEQKLNLTKDVENNTNTRHLTKSDKVCSEKQSMTEEKDKVNKLTNILESSLCDNPVDGGNTRLELAEEFLATSPTAAFLMSFPLVSGNRADSPVEDTQNNVQLASKDNEHRRNDSHTQTNVYLDKNSDNKIKPSVKVNTIAENSNSSKDILHNKYLNTTTKNSEANKMFTVAPVTNTSNENPFLNLPSVISTSCALTDSSYGLDFECNMIKSVSTQPTSYVSGNNIFYKSDTFNTVKNNIYSTSSISSSHDFNSFGLYPCAMEKYAAKNKCDFTNVEDNIVKIGSSRLTYDIDLGWSHKSFDFVGSTNSTTVNKDTILTTAAGQYSSTYNPFNPEFHVSLTPTTNKRDALVKTNSSFVDTLTSFYSQPTNLWTDDVPFYTNANITKPLKQQSYINIPNDHSQTNHKAHDSKQPTETEDVIKSSSITTKHHAGTVPGDKNTKKSPSKMHINWMTSEIRPIHNSCNTAIIDTKENHRTPYTQLDQQPKKQEHSEMNNYFPISMHNFVTQPSQEELLSWQPARGTGTTEISIEPPPINLPTLVGDLALGPHDKKKNIDPSNRCMPQSDFQNCNNFFSVSQLMNRSIDNVMPSRFQGPNTEAQKSNQLKQNITNSSNDSSRKSIPRLDSQLPHSYIFNDLKPANSFDGNNFAINKSKINKPDKNQKTQKNSYSAEALIRGGTCSQKLQENNKFNTSSQRYTELNMPQDSSIAQVSHFPPILDYSDNNYHGQSTLYNSTTNTMSNSFYSNFVPGSGNLMSSNYGSGHFSGEFIDYTQASECSYSNNELKIRNNPAAFQQDKVSSNFKNSRRESSKHKLEYSKKEPNKKYQSKRIKLNADVEEWNNASNLLWQNRTPIKKPSNLPEEPSFTNYAGNQMSAQYQPDFFNSHLMHPNIQTGSQNVDRSLSSFPVTSRANFNLSTIFPEIAMKVQ